MRGRVGRGLTLQSRDRLWSYRPSSPDEKCKAMKLDIFCHLFPRPFYDRMVEVLPDAKDMFKRVRNVPSMSFIGRQAMKPLKRSG